MEQNRNWNNHTQKNNNFDWSDFACRSFQGTRTGIKLNRTIISSLYFNSDEELSVNEPHFLMN